MWDQEIIETSDNLLIFILPCVSIVLIRRKNCTLFLQAAEQDVITDTYY